MVNFNDDIRLTENVCAVALCLSLSVSNTETKFCA